MATDQEQNLARINQGLDQTLTKIKEINRNPVRPGQTGIEKNLDAELKRRKLTTNDPT